MAPSLLTPPSLMATPSTLASWFSRARNREWGSSDGFTRVLLRQRSLASLSTVATMTGHGSTVRTRATTRGRLVRFPPLLPLHLFLILTPPADANLRQLGPISPATYGSSEDTV